MARRTTSGTGRRQPKVKRKSETRGERAPRSRAGREPVECAFTLLELLVTLALIALLASVLIVGSARLLADQPATPEDIFRKAVGEARKYAVEHDTEVRLGYDPKGKVFRAGTTAGTRHFPVTAPGEVTFDFLAAQKGGSAVMIAGIIVETQPLPFVTFYPDGTCSPFRVQLRTAGSARVIAIDPWTCAPMLESEVR
ncbi:MAG: prepilin-type N-terminal cleavage/methylation domain-containing protein [Opitutaceae bacterium]|nr:prepilin-type N-terminal cleavage/methylation domain-containing protein [Opitutaceae bacterium]